ncbi:MAG: sugar transferase [Sphingobacteriales bacterium]|nr:MAG: sugar transferase [Sphingobacteriales bacterium]
MIRLLDLILSLLLLVIFIPVFLLLSLWIKLDSRGPIIYRQKRVGRFGKEFFMWKFRTMYIDSGNKLLLTLGDDDKRITPVGYYLRKLKLDELPQLVNVLLGEMSIVGPRPEVKKYVDLYTHEQRKVLNVRPGITDYASIAYANENELLAGRTNPEQLYIDTIMPEKIKLNQRFIDRPSVGNYFRIIFLTAKKVVTKKGA